LLDPTTSFPERFEAVMTDMLAGRHISQTEPEQPGLFRKPSENDDEQAEF
jgi:hypothetical protein